MTHGEEIALHLERVAAVFEARGGQSDIEFAAWAREQAAHFRVMTEEGMDREIPLDDVAALLVPEA